MLKSSSAVEILHPVLENVLNMDIPFLIRIPQIKTFFGMTSLKVILGQNQHWVSSRHTTLYLSIHKSNVSILTIVQNFHNTFSNSVLISIDFGDFTSLFTP